MAPTYMGRTRQLHDWSLFHDVSFHKLAQTAGRSTALGLTLGRLCLFMVDYCEQLSQFWRAKEVSLFYFKIYYQNLCIIHNTASLSLTFEATVLWQCKLTLIFKEPPLDRQKQGCQQKMSSSIYSLGSSTSLRQIIAACALLFRQNTTSWSKMLLKRLEGMSLKSS